jgi:hypothetical protein
MAILKPENVLDVAREPARAVDETSDERFDRAAFARRALAIVRPPRTTVAICEGAARMRVESGRAWGQGHGERWALLAIPPAASRRAIALAIVELAPREHRPWALDVLLGALEHGRADVASCYEHGAQ